MVGLPAAAELAKRLPDEPVAAVYASTAVLVSHGAATRLAGSRSRSMSTARSPTPLPGQCRDSPAGGGWCWLALPALGQHRAELTRRPRRDRDSPRPVDSDAEGSVREGSRCGPVTIWVCELNE